MRIIIKERTMNNLKRDNLEITISMISGAVINYLLTLYLFGVSAEYAIGTSVVFFTCSYLRSIIIRRIFRKGEEE